MTANPSLHRTLAALRRPLGAGWHRVPAIMSRILVVALVLASSVLASRTIENPVYTSCDASQYDAGRLIKEWKLSASQLNYLNRWLADHRTGWHPTPANYAPSLLLTLHGGNHVSTVNINPTFVVVTDSPLSYMRAFTEAELSML